VTIDHRPFTQRFRPDSYSALVDTVTKVTRGNEVAAYAMITSVQVASDGSGVTLTMEVIDSAEEAAA
jgi:hypothetical protein